MAHMHAQSRFWVVKTVTPVLFFSLRARAALDGRKRNVHLEMRKLKQTNRGKKG